MEDSQIAVVMVPLPAQSHLDRLLQLAVVLSSRGLPVHFIGSATHNRQAKHRAHGLNPKSVAKIHFHDFPTPPLVPFPSHNRIEPAGSVKIPQDITPSVIAYNNFRNPVTSFVQKLSKKTRKIVLIFDRFIPEAVNDAVSIPNVESYALNCISAYNLFYLYWESMGRPFKVEIVQNMKECFPPEFINFLASKSNPIEKRAGDIFNTNRLIDGEYIDLLAKHESKTSTGRCRRQWAIGSHLLPIISRSESKNDGSTRHACLQWLDKQAPKSVIYVSFGTSISLSEEEAGEIAIGLEESGHKFVWAAKGADKADIFSTDDETRVCLPLGFEERVGGRGRVEREWVPQVEILGHESVGGFMSHCGWNSLLESLTMGVPIAAWPMHTDQPLNAVLVTQVLRAGLSVREWGEREEVVKAAAVKNAVERLMGSEEGDEVRKRVEQMSAAIKESMEDGGECGKELDDFIAHITR